MLAALIERQTGAKLQTRNWKTITRLVEKYALITG